MTTKITAQQCKTELENILMDAVENSNFNYKVEVSKKNYYSSLAGGLSIFKEIKIAIKGRECETKEIFVDVDYTALDSEEVRVAEVRLEELLCWSKGLWLGPKDKADEVRILNGNNIITQLILAQRLQIATKGSVKDLIKVLKSAPELTFADSTEFWVLIEETGYAGLHGTLGSFFNSVYSRNRSKSYPWQKNVDLHYCTYFKTTVKEIKEAFKNYDKAELGRYKTLIDKELFHK